MFCFSIYSHSHLEVRIPLEMWRRNTVGSLLARSQGKRFGSTHNASATPKAAEGATQTKTPMDDNPLSEVNPLIKLWNGFPTPVKGVIVLAVSVELLMELNFLSQYKGKLWGKKDDFDIFKYDAELAAKAKGESAGSHGHH